MVLALKESQHFNRYPLAWNSILGLLVSLAFVLSDWGVFYSSFGDFILALVFFLMLGLKLVKVTKIQVAIILFFLLTVIVTSTYSYFLYNHWFEVDRLVLSTAKILLYMTTLMLFYNHVIHNNLRNFFLRISNFTGVFVVLTAILIMVLIYFDLSHIYNTIWTFTRTDELSYTYGPDLIRARGVFSEPAHLGYYLNTLFFANIFSHQKSKLMLLITLSVGILLTFSYSMIGIFVLTNIAIIIKKFLEGKYKWSNYHLITVAIFAGVLFIAKELLNVAIVERTVNILSGQDGSAYNRLFESWMWVDRDRLGFGNLIGHTPPITNIFAYILSDFGLFGLIPYLLFTLFIAIINFPAFIYFVGMNIAKGGYLNPAFWLLLLYLFLYFINNKVKD